MGIAYNTKIVTDSLALCLDAANVRSYPGTGTTWYDLSGTGKHGSFVNGPTYSSSNSGTIVFDGVDDTVTLGSVTTLSNTALSLSAWIYDAGTSGNFRFIAENGNQFIFRFDSDAEGGNLSAFVSIGGSPEPRLSTSCPKNTWINVAFTWNTNGNFRLFKNGVLANSSNSRTGTLNSPAGNFQISSPGLPFKGNISNMLVYNKTLTDAEVLQNFNALRGRYGV